MTSELEKLKDDLLGLPRNSRASLAFALIASLEEEIDDDVIRGKKRYDEGIET